jgi:energy-coupling factor transporter ATP-binding protein EcfA2
MATTGTPADAPEGAAPVKILLDTPSANPGLKFGPMAAALAKIIETSQPRFAVGIFGDWGSGKTTFMDALARHLSDESTVAVQFNAWRFEREPHLLIPLLDTVRESLTAWAKARPTEPRERVRDAARRIGRVVRALAAGASGEVGVPGAIKLKYDVGDALEELDAGDREGQRPQSLYFAGFQELSNALKGLESDGISRIVVFVDDLDRCLPANALEVLESMKLFFDLEGVVFVVGLDEEIVERAVRAKFAETQADQPAVVGDGAGATADGDDARVRPAPAQSLSRDYVKKIFQLPFALPPVGADQLDELLTSIYRDARLGDEQYTDLRDRVRKYLRHVAREGRVNPRQVKRFINAYTLQTLVKPQLDRDIVLALQTIVFNEDWAPAYEAIVGDWLSFRNDLERYRTGDEAALADLWPREHPAPPDLTTYLLSEEVVPMANEQNLDAYIYSLESTRSTQHWVIEAYKDLSEVRRLIRAMNDSQAVTGEEFSRLADMLGKALSSLASHVGTARTANSSRLLQLVDETAEINRQLHPPGVPPEEAEAIVRTRLAQLTAQEPRLKRQVALVRDTASFSPS